MTCFIWSVSSVYTLCGALPGKSVPSQIDRATSGFSTSGNSETGPFTKVGSAVGRKKPVIPSCFGVGRALTLMTPTER